MTAAGFFIQNFLKPKCIWFEVSFYVYQFIGGENDSNSNTGWSQRHSLYQTVSKKVSNNKLLVKSNLLRYKSHNTISIPEQFIRNNVQQGECPTKSLHFWRDQALSLPCLKGHVRARGSTLWRQRWQEASEIFCTKAPLFGGSWVTKNIAKTPQKCSLRRATNVTFSKFRGWCRRSVRSWLSSTTAGRHLAPSPDGGAPQRKGSFFSKIKISLDFLRTIVIFQSTKTLFFTYSFASWPEFIVIVCRQYKPLRTHTLKLVQTRPVPAPAAARRCL